MWLNQFVFSNPPHPSSATREGIVASPPRYRHFTRPDMAAGRPLEDDLQHCRRRIREEQARADEAGSPEAGLVHEQVAMLYRSQLATLLRQQHQLLATANAD